MKKFHPLFVIGTVGMIAAASVHMFLALCLSLYSIHSVFFTLYSVFLTFLILGFAFTIKQKNTLV